MPIVQTDTAQTYARCKTAITELVKAYPFLKSRVLTKTRCGREVLTLTVGSGPRKLLYTAAHHANEWITTPILLKFVEEFAESLQRGGRIGGVDARTLAENVTIHTVPMVDPDGVDLVTGAIEPDSEPYRAAQGLAQRYPQIPFPDGWKADLVGVDLNLQYPAGWLRAREIKFSQGYTRPGPRDYVGRAPLTQPESRALAEFTRRIDPALVLAYHTQGKVIYWQFEDVFVPGAEELGEKLAKVSGYTLAQTPQESAYAGYKDWFIREFGRPGYTVEAGEGENPLPLTQFPEIYRDNLPLLIAAATGTTPRV